MRTIDTNGLTCLGEEGIGPWRLDDDRLLRTAYQKRPFKTLNQAQKTFDTYRAAYDTGARTPAPLEIVRVGEGFGVVVEYVRGVELGFHILYGSYEIDEAGFEIGKLQRTLHEGHMHRGADIKAKFLDWARASATLMPSKAGVRLVALVEGAPSGDALLHGDLHLGNVLVSNGVLALIDMELAGFGDPIFDLAISRSRTFRNAPQEAARVGIPQEHLDEYVELCWKAQLTGYLGDVGIARVEQIDLQTHLLAELEFLGFSCHVSDANCASWRRHPEVAEAISNLSDLVPQVASLGLG